MLVTVQPPLDPESRRRGAASGPSRRAFVGTVAGSLAVGAGCLDRGGGGGGGGGGDGPDGYGDWFGDVDDYDGFVDRTGTDRTTVKVGADDGLAFAPAAIEVSPGTTVVWTWTGKGGSHNVVERDDAFSSPYHQTEGATFEHTFDEVGAFPYYCQPHRNLGMKGGVTVRDGSTTASDAR